MRTYDNPVVAGLHPDPSLCRVGEDYYLVCSSFEYFPGVPIFHSRDLVHWRQIGNVLDRPEQLSCRPRRGRPGASSRPRIRHHDGRFWLITTNIAAGGQLHRDRRRTPPVPGRSRSGSTCPASTPTWPGTRTARAGAPSPGSRWRRIDPVAGRCWRALAQLERHRAAVSGGPPPLPASAGGGTCCSPRAAPSAATPSRSPGPVAARPVRARAGQPDPDPPQYNRPIQSTGHADLVSARRRQLVDDPARDPAPWSQSGVPRARPGDLPRSGAVGGRLADRRPGPGTRAGTQRLASGRRTAGTARTSTTRRWRRTGSRRAPGRTTPGR